MKKLLFGLIVTLFLSADLYAQAPTARVSGKIRVELTFGRVSKGCSGFGVCSFKVYYEVDPQELVEDLIEGLFSKDGEKLTVVFNEAFYLKNRAKFSGQSFFIEEDYSIDKETSKALGYSNKYTIKAGKYPIVFDKATKTYSCKL